MKEDIKVEEHEGYKIIRLNNQPAKWFKIGLCVLGTITSIHGFVLGVFIALKAAPLLWRIFN